MFIVETILELQTELDYKSDDYMPDKKTVVLLIFSEASSSPCNKYSLESLLKFLHTPPVKKMR